MIRIAIIPLMLLLAACGSAERKNPLADQDMTALASWLAQKVNVGDEKRPQLIACATFWSSQTGTDLAPDGSSDCNTIATWLAEEMTAANFGTIKPEDVSYPPFAQTYLTYAGNQYDPNATKGIIR